MKNPIKPTIKTEIVPILSLLAMAMAAILIYPKLPAQVATHWNTAGEVDRWSSPFLVAVFFPLFAAGIYILMVFAPYLDPKRVRYRKFLKVYHVFKAFLTLILALLFILILLSGIGYEIAIDFWVPMLIGLFFVVTGNYLGKVRFNWFFGIRNPWTLSSEEVWNKTHRMGGWVFILIGLAMMFSYFIPVEYKLPFIITITLGLILLTFIYSYWIHKKINK